MNIYYTYLIGWSNQNKYYYGVRYKNNCNPKELWVSYKTSSKHVKNFVKMYGEPDIIKIRKIFCDKNKARIWEHKVLKRMRVIFDDRFLNKTDNICFDSESCKKGSSKKRSMKTREKMRNSRIGKNHSELTKQKIGKAHLGKKFTKERLEQHKKMCNENKTKVSNTLKAHYVNGMINSFKDKRHTEESKMKMKNKLKGRFLGMKWYNNGIKNIRCFPNNEPGGFVIGRLNNNK